jgi:hypothetical protein
MRPARRLGHPEHALGQVLVRILGSGLVLLQQSGVFGLEGSGDVLEEDQPQDDVLVIGGLEVLAELVGRQEQLSLEAEVGPAVSFGCLLGGFLPGTSLGHIFAHQPARKIASVGQRQWECNRVELLSPQVTQVHARLSKSGRLPIAKRRGMATRRRLPKTQSERAITRSS